MEGFGNAILETWGSRRPLITTRSRGAVEVTTHEIDSWQVPCRDADSLRDGILLLLSDERLRRELAEIGSTRLARTFSREKVMEQYKSLYERVTHKFG